jgi:hypothetical protein
MNRRGAATPDSPPTQCDRQSPKLNIRRDRETECLHGLKVEFPDLAKDIGAVGTAVLCQFAPCLVGAPEWPT